MPLQRAVPNTVIPTIHPNTRMGWGDGRDQKQENKKSSEENNKYSNSHLLGRILCLLIFCT